MREVLEKEIGNIKPSHDEIKHIHDIVAKFLDLIKAKLKKANADIILGGSFAKDTLIKKNKYDIDFFIRFDYNKYYDNSYEISGILESILNQVIKKISPMPKMERIHGSRDYFMINFSNASIKLSFEIIPVLNIKNSWQAVNVTDTSPLHVEYIKNNIRRNKKLANEIRLAKAFCYASKCYGAESHIKGFSGYSLELLTSHHGSFVNLIKSFSRCNLKEKIIIDPEKFYKKGDVFKKLNRPTTS